MTTPKPIAHPPSIPFLGNIFDVDPDNPWVSLNKLAEKHGPIFKLKLFGHQTIFVSSAALVEEICDESRFRKCLSGPTVEFRQVVNKSLLTAYDHEASWGIAHRIVAPLFTRSAIQSQVRDMQRTADLLLVKWMKRSSHQAFDVTAELRRLNAMAAVKCLFGQEQRYLEGDEPAICVAMERAMQEAVKRPARSKVMNSLVFKRRFLQDINTMRSFAADIIAKRQSQQTIDGDMLNALLHAIDPQTKQALTTEQVIDEIVSLLIGTVSAPNLLSFVFYHLAKSPEEVIKARYEIEGLLGREGQITYEHLSRLPYCEAILRESMRLSTPAPGFMVEPIPEQLKGGCLFLAEGKYEISRDQPLMAILSAANRDPAVFDDPDVFRPDRMLSENFDNLPTGVKKGFGNGKRQCIGKEYAWQWCLVTFVTLIRNIDIQLANSGYQLKVDGGFSLKPVEFLATACAVTKRLDSKQ